MIKYLQLPFHFDVKKLQEDLVRTNNMDWKLHYQQLHYDGNWTALPLRSIKGDTENIYAFLEHGTEHKDTVFLENCNYFREVLSSFKCPLLTVRLLKLGAGSVIKEHTDAELNYENGMIRIHIPVVTNDAVEFYLDKEKMTLKEGECWYMNFNLPHSLKNLGTSDRVHLVIDAEVNDWVKELFSKPAMNRKEMDEPGYDEETKKMIIARLREQNTETSNRLADEMESSIK